MVECAQTPSALCTLTKQTRLRLLPCTRAEYDDASFVVMERILVRLLSIMRVVACSLCSERED